MSEFYLTQDLFKVNAEELIFTTLEAFIFKIY